MEREVGGGIGMGNTCKPMAVSFRCMTKSTTIKKIIIINKFKKRKKCLHCSTGILAFPVWTSELDYLAKASITTGGQAKYYSHLHQAINALIGKQTFAPM